MVQLTLPKGSKPTKGKVWPGPKTANGKIKRYEMRHRAAVDGVLRKGQAPGPKK